MLQSESFGKYAERGKYNKNIVKRKEKVVEISEIEPLTS